MTLPANYITKEYLKEYLDAKDYVTRTEFVAFEKRFDVKFEDLRNDFYVHTGALMKDLRDDFHRHTGALIEESKGHAKMIAEALHMQIERVDRHEEQNSADNENFDRRICRLESKVLLRRKKA